MCSACSREKGQRAPTSHRATRRLRRPHTFPTSTPWGLIQHHVRGQSLASPVTIRIAVVKRFVADMGANYLNDIVVDICNNNGIRREFMATFSPQQNGSAESAISRAFKAVHTTDPGVRQLNPDVHLEKGGCKDAEGTTYGWCFFCGHLNALTERLHPSTASGYSPTRCSTEGDHFCHCYSSFSPRITGHSTSGGRTPGLACFTSATSSTSMDGAAMKSWTSRRGGANCRASHATNWGHRGSPRSGLCRQRRRGIFTLYACRRAYCHTSIS